MIAPNFTYKTRSRILKAISLLLLCVPLAPITLWADQLDLDSELEQLKVELQSDKFRVLEPLFEKLRWTGRNNKEIYATIRAKFEVYQHEESIDLAVLSLKGLAYSGNKRYVTFYEDLIENSLDEQIRSSAEQALANLDVHHRWNKSISKRNIEANKGYLTQTRVLNMLRSRDPILALQGAKLAAGAYRSDKNITDLAAKLLHRSYNIYDDQERINDFEELKSWYCIILESSQRDIYLPLLREVKESAVYAKVRKRAKRAIKHIEKQTN